MLRSRLRNIINKSKEFSKPIGESPFELFKKTLPKEILIGDNYRLEAAWKAYGSPKNYKEALWEGMIQPIDENTFKLPSIGYNEETDSYEYLNKGRENETVAKDIRVWDNDVIPFVKELKNGGYIRIYDEEKDCWTYSKNTQSKTKGQENEINSFKEGGKSKSYQEWLKTVPEDRLSNNYDLETAYKYLPIEELEKWRAATPEQLKLNEYHLRSVAPYGSEDYIFLKKGREWNNPEIQGELNAYHTGQTGLLYSHDLIFDEDLNRYFYKKKKGFNPQAFKLGGLMNLIPEGSLHAHKNHMDLAEKGEITPKGVPVIDNNGELQAEIEREEWTMSKELTEDVENWYKKYYNEETSDKDKDELAIKCGKRITEELLHNTDDRANLIAKLMEDEE